MSDGIRAMWMRGGTSKGGFFLGQDLPDSAKARDALLLGIMGSPDSRQINGMGGADPLTSKVAVVRKSHRAGVDVDYLFLQVFVDRPLVSDAQNCGNMLAGVAPFAVERGLVAAQDGETPVTIYMENTGQIAVAQVQTPGGKVSYMGDAQIDGVPGTSAPVPIEFKDTAGSSCGALLPTGHVVDVVDGVELTMIDNGMPCVVMRASDMGITGLESPEELESNVALRAKLEAIRLTCGPLMNLGDVTTKTVPKMTMISAPRNGGAISTRTFIPHRCHKTIGVLGAVSVATACLIEGTPAQKLANTGQSLTRTLPVEHPAGEMTVVAKLDQAGGVTSTAILRTARKLMDGEVYP
ncbi:4-oxalomesaconate tautomerase [Parasedimentitalea psychrophila]|uniref:4-oxalomesaconate tautomerase n=1 Tax=Parasedimentitalea psychrophila TaxID=2997337 RepID=A0A9Y2P7R1_9RHOB|nr:4-oxalomesaconate tautomerase [Parasedimentitalea psychrophila]WIY26085.1 4-oxalomesaconate tautomerase [Parasedimentitalea psychrophila]